MNRLRLGLRPLLFLAAALSIAVGLGTVAVSVHAVASRQLSAYAARRDAALGHRIATSLQALYAADGWVGVMRGTQHYADLFDTPISILGPRGAHLFTVAPTGAESGTAPPPPRGPVLRVALAGPEGQPLGTVLLRRPPALEPKLSPILETIETALLRASLVGFVAALGLSMLVGDRIVAPLRRIAEGVRRLGAGDLGHRVQPGGPVEVAGLAEDFNRMAAALETSERSRQQLVADVAHELRTPLTILRGYLEAMAEGVVPVGAEALGMATDQARRLSQLVSDLQDLALADAHQLTLERRDVDVADLLHRLHAAWRLEADKKGVTLRLAPLPAPLPPVRADARRLEQALGNLLDNAVKYTPPGGRVILSAEALADHVAVAVTDNGPGIPPDALPHVFDRLYRVDPARTQATGGFGLGLAIAKQLIELNGGHVTVTSTVGQGTRFLVTLPTRGAAGRS
ncbi:MAG: HAMP domain-containing histidine kinase [Actinomycetia bacterium]|nr:HAMP domain-containing histidine kinase [Actinomycetes bacterium]